MTSLKAASNTIDNLCACDRPVLEDRFDMVAEGDRMVVSDDDIIVELVPPTDESLSGYECKVCGISHEAYFREGAGIEEQWKEELLRLNSTLEDEVVQCEHGFMMTRLSLLDYNANKDARQINAAHLYCPACDVVHEGKYKVVSQGHNCRDTDVICPGGRIMPRQVLLDYSRKKIQEAIVRNTRTEVIKKEV